MGSNNTLNYFKQPGASGDNELVINGTITLASGSLINTAGSLTLAGDLTVSGGDIDAGASGAVGTVDIFPATAASGKTRITAANNAGDTITTITNASQSGARTYTIPDAGASASFVMTEGAQTINGTKTIPAIVTTNLDAGASGTAGSIDVFPTTASKGKIAITATANTNDDTLAITNAAMGQATTLTIPDPAAASAQFTLNTNKTGFVRFFGLQDVLNYSAGTWTTTRVAQADYVKRKTAADDTTIIGIDITEALRTTASKGLMINSFDVIFRNTTADLDAHSVVLDKIAYTNSAVVTVTSVAITGGTLPVGQDADPQIAAVTVDTPAFNVTDDSKYVIELTVNAAAGSVYDFIGVMLKFTRNDL